MAEMAQISWENKIPRRKRETDGIDRISELPEHVAHHILSFLPTKDVFHTSSLSKLWKTTCSTLPILNFDETFFDGVGELWDLFNEEETRNKREKLINFVEQTLQRRLSQGITISELVLDIPSTVSCSSEGFVLVDRWIGYAMNSVKHLFLDIDSPQYKLFSLPLILFSFKKLRLSSTSIGDECFQNLIHCSKDLEDLSIDNCSWLKRVEITGLLKLRKLSLTNIS